MADQQSNDLDALLHAKQELLKLFDEHTSGLDSQVSTHWRDMVHAKSQLDIKLLEQIEINDTHPKLVEYYKTQIANLRQRLEQAEQTIRDQDETIKRLQQSAVDTYTSKE